MMLGNVTALQQNKGMVVDNTPLQRHPRGKGGFREIPREVHLSTLGIERPGSFLQMMIADCRWWLHGPASLIHRIPAEAPQTLVILDSQCGAKVPI